MSNINKNPNIQNNQNKNKKLLFSNLSNLERGLYDEISRLIDIPDVMRILDSSHFFVKEYLQQEFKESSRFKIDKIHREKGVPLKESHEKRLRKNEKTSVKFIPYFNLYGENQNKKSQELQLSNFEEQKPKLRYFTMGSKQHPKQFERWSPEEMYNWWLELRTSDIPKLEWKILDAVFFLFINQISCICNSYIRYGIKNNSNNKKIFKEELELLRKYFRLLDDFYISGGEYGKLLDTHIAFCYLFECRIRTSESLISYVEYQNNNENITKLFNEKIENKIISTSTFGSNNIRLMIYKLQTYRDGDNFYLILFTSFFQKPSNFINLYSIPIITAIGVPHKSHNAQFYLPFSQISHDIFTHSYLLLDYLNYLYSLYNYGNDIRLFRKKMIFLKLLYKKKSDEQLLFWFIIHEAIFNIRNIIGKLIPEINFEENSIKSFEEKHEIIKKYYKNKINSIFETYPARIKNNLQKYFTVNDQNISNFFDIQFLLEQLKILRHFIMGLISEEEKDTLQRIRKSIDVLIEICNETIEIVKTQRNNNN